jgi:hypothetical protein
MRTADARTARKNGRSALDGHPGRCGLHRDAVGVVVLLVGLEDQIADAIDDRSQQCEAAAFAVHGVLPGGECHVAAVPPAALPDRKPDQLQALERALAEVNSASASLPGGVSLSFCTNFTVIVRASVVVICVSLLVPRTCGSFIGEETQGADWWTSVAAWSTKRPQAHTEVT